MHISKISEGKQNSRFRKQIHLDDAIRKLQTLRSKQLVPTPNTKQKMHKLSQKYACIWCFLCQAKCTSKLNKNSITFPNNQSSYYLFLLLHFMKLDPKPFQICIILGHENIYKDPFHELYSKFFMLSHATSTPQETLHQGTEWSNFGFTQQLLAVFHPYVSIQDGSIEMQKNYYEYIVTNIDN